MSTPALPGKTWVQFDSPVTDPFKVYKVPDEEKEWSKTVDERDSGCPDEWLPRRKEMLRLTGLHPFNSEPPIQLLMDKGWLTPAALHYVRNHGSVPKLDWNTHKIALKDVNGKVIASISMEELSQMPSRTLPVTLTCAGNRRKEQNLVAKGKGFSWGCAAVSTSIWKGVPLAYILTHYGLVDKSGKNLPKYVNCSGADALPNGKYGTSITMDIALSPARDVLIAYEQNGKRLLPDHGYPCRLLVPGYIGGRMIKWLADIQVSNNESDSYYHYYDNRVVPPHITNPKDPAFKDWRYIINDRNINSAITRPANNEILNLGLSPEKYTVKGYAYNGGGRRITRIEISLDGGKTWELTELYQPERATPYGRYWCWTHWSCEIETLRLLTTKDIACRAWDESTNTQPGNLTWNVLGMMNNPWFRVKIKPVRTVDGLALSFKHPASIEAGGWMEDKYGPVGGRKEEPKKEDLAAIKRLKSYTKAEVSKHNTKTDCWIILSGLVYDVTSWIDGHPGGKASILMKGGKDATKAFDMIHSKQARAMLKKYLIGKVSGKSKL